MRILVTGASGFVGGHLHRGLLAQGHHVVGYVRQRQPARDGVEWVVGEMDDAATLTRALAGCAAVIHLVGILKERGRETFTEAHVETTRHLLDAMQTAGVKRLLHMSALGVDPVQRAPYFRSKWQAEELLHASDLNYTIFRPTLIYGPGDVFFATLVYQLRHYPLIPIIGRGDYRFAPLHISTVCAACVEALALPETSGETYLLCGPDEVSYRELVTMLADEMGLRKARIYLPVAVMSAVIALAGRLNLPLPITPEQLTMLLRGSTCEPRLVSTLPHLPPIHLRDGIAAYVRAYTEVGHFTRRVK